MQRFFSHHLIETFGCDYSTSGVTLEALQAKLRTFLELQTADGPRHDTYLVFYSGHTHRSGEWALAGQNYLPRVYYMCHTRKIRGHPSTMAGSRGVVAHNSMEF